MGRARLVDGIKIHQIFQIFHNQSNAALCEDHPRMTSGFSFCGYAGGIF